MKQINYDLIKKPLVTEKTTLLSEQNKYIFEVMRDANKFAIKTLVEQVFDVKVKSVNVLNQKGKVKRFKGVFGRRSGMKKAIVTLEKDYSIDLAVGGK